VTDFWNFCAMGSSGKFKRSSVASQTGQPGKGGGLVGSVYRERVVTHRTLKKCCGRNPEGLPLEACCDHDLLKIMNNEKNDFKNARTVF
jgi:hypothetical protein